MATAEEHQGVPRQAKDPRLKEDEEDVEGEIFALQLHAVSVSAFAKSSTRA